MFVQRVVMPVTGTESWTLLGGDGMVVEPVERYRRIWPRWSGLRTRFGLMPRV